MAESFGRYLRRERELREISLAEISRQTKIKPAILTALEEDRFPDLPPVAFVRGFVRNYAECIGLDPNDALLRLEHFLQENFPDQVPASGAGPRRTFSLKRRFLLFFGLFLAGLFFFASIYGARFLARFSAPPPAPPSAADPRTGESAVSAPAPAAASPSRVRVYLEATDLCWLQYTLDRAAAQEAKLTAGDTLSLEADQSIQLLVGNAGGLRIQYQGQWLSSLGGRPGRPLRLSFPVAAESSAAPVPTPAQSHP